MLKGSYRSSWRYFKEILLSERTSWQGLHAENPFVLLCQPSLFDSTRAPEGKHTLWAYCHMPNGLRVDMTERIENQIEGFAPGFRDLIFARHSMSQSIFSGITPT